MNNENKVACGKCGEECIPCRDDVEYGEMCEGCWQVIRPGRMAELEYWQTHTRCHLCSTAVLDEDINIVSRFGSIEDSMACCDECAVIVEKLSAENVRYCGSEEHIEQFEVDTVFGDTHCQRCGEDATEVRIVRVSVEGFAPYSNAYCDGCACKVPEIMEEVYYNDYWTRNGRCEKCLDTVPRDTMRYVHLSDMCDKCATEEEKWGEELTVCATEEEFAEGTGPRIFVNPAEEHGYDCLCEAPLFSTQEVSISLAGWMMKGHFCKHCLDPAYEYGPLIHEIRREIRGERTQCPVIRFYDIEVVKEE